MYIHIRVYMLYIIYSEHASLSDTRRYILAQCLLITIKHIHIKYMCINLAYCKLMCWCNNYCEIYYITLEMPCKSISSIDLNVQKQKVSNYAKFVHKTSHYSVHAVMNIVACFRWRIIIVYLSKHWLSYKYLQTLSISKQKKQVDKSTQNKYYFYTGSDMHQFISTL